MKKAYTLLTLLTFSLFSFQACNNGLEEGTALLLFGLTEGDNSGVNILSVGEVTAYVPTTMTTDTPKPGGDFTGETFTGSTSDVKGFIASVPTSGDVSALMDRILAEINGDTTTFATVDLVLRQTITNAPLPTVVAHLELTTNSSQVTNTLRNTLVGLVGTATEPSGTVTNLPSSTAGTSSTGFRMVIQASQECGATVLAVISPTSQYSALESQIITLVDGTNVDCSTSSKSFINGSFTTSGTSLADFLFVVDNSGSMSEEQATVVSNALTFFDRLNTIGADFRIGVITSDSSTLQGTGFTNDRTQFQTDIAAGTGGNAIEAGIWFAEVALNSGGSVVNAGYPRSGASMSVIMVSDEADQYRANEGDTANPGNPGKLTFNTTSNVFLNNGYKVYGIIGLTGAGAAGTCSGAVGKADNANNSYAGGSNIFNGNTNYLGYWSLASDTGGAVSSICANNYGAFLENLADQAAANASNIVLSPTPISASLSVYLNGVALERTNNPASGTTGYAFDATTNKISFTGVTPVSGQVLSVSYLSFN